jgi:gliding motility-associated-like protein
VRSIFSIVLFLIPLSVLAQLSAPGSTSVRFTSYLSDPALRHPIFVYCNESGSQTGTLNAVSPGGTGPFNFAWYKWSTVSNSFSIPVKTENGVMNSSAASLGAGGYNVIITGGFDTILVGWIVFDTPPVAAAGLLNPAKHCNYVALDGTAAATVTAFQYFDPGTGNPLSLKNELTFLWSSDPVSSIPHPGIDIDPITFSPPLEDVTYNLKVSTLGCSSEASFFYESIHIKADFTIDPMEGEAPLEVSLTDNSIRGYTYEWDFGDDSVSNLSDPLPHTYYKPGEYTILLTIESELHCIDSLRSQTITVEPSALAIPNVFTPDGDGYNDWFMIESKSMRFVSMEVFSRSGLKVYGFSGTDERLKEWTGWDGNVNNSSIKASPGVYFYIIRAYGWDDIEYDSKEYRGFVYLYR